MGVPSSCSRTLIFRCDGRASGQLQLAELAGGFEQQELIGGMQLAGPAQLFQRRLGVAPCAAPCSEFPMAPNSWLWRGGHELRLQPAIGSWRVRPSAADAPRERAALRTLTRRGAEQQRRDRKVVAPAQRSFAPFFISPRSEGSVERPFDQALQREASTTACHDASSHSGRQCFRAGAEPI